MNQTSATNAVANQFESNTAKDIAISRLGWSSVGQLASGRLRRLSREFLWIGLGQAAAVSGAVLGVRVLTGVLRPRVYGTLALAMTAASLIQIVVLGPLSNGATRFFAPAREAGALPSYLAAVRGLLVRATAAVLLIAVVLCSGLVASGYSQWVGLALAAVLFALLSGYNCVLNGMQNAARQRAVVALHHGALSWARFLLAGGMVLWLGATSTMAMIGYCAATVLVLVSQRWFFCRTLEPSQVSAEAAQASQAPQWSAGIVRYAWPFATWGLLGWGRLVSDRWALQVFATTEDVGFYAVLFQLGYYPVTIVTGLLTELLSPIWFQRAGDGSDLRRVQRVCILSWGLTGVVLAGTFIGTVLTMHLHKTLFGLLVSSEYHFVSGLLPGVILASGLFAAAQVCSLGPMSRMDSKCLAVPKNVTATMGILMNSLGAIWLGLTGVVAANILFSLGHLIWVTWISVRNFPKTK